MLRYHSPSYTPNKLNVKTEEETRCVPTRLTPLTSSFSTLKHAGVGDDPARQGIYSRQKFLGTLPQL